VQFCDALYSVLLIRCIFYMVIGSSVAARREGFSGCNVLASSQFFKLIFVRTHVGK
jgi:hypothetical protein